MYYDTPSSLYHSDQCINRRHMGTYLGLFNGTICVPQIVAASLGGIVLKMFTSPGSVAPEVNMLVLAGVFLIIGAGCVSIIKER